MQKPRPVASSAAGRFICGQVTGSGNNGPGRQVPGALMRTAAVAALLTVPASAFAAPLADVASAGDPVASFLSTAGAFVALAAMAVLGGRRKAPVPVPAHRRSNSRRRR